MVYHWLISDWFASVEIILWFDDLTDQGSGEDERFATTDSSKGVSRASVPEADRHCAGQFLLYFGFSGEEYTGIPFFM